MQIIRTSRFIFVAVFSISAVLTNEALADLTSVNWVSDSYNSFDVILSGTGLGWFGTVISPSGLWQVDSQNEIDYDANLIFPGSSDGTVFVGNTADAVYLGQLPSQYPPPPPYMPSPNFPNQALQYPNGTGAALYDLNYDDNFAPVAPINDENSLGYNGASVAGYLSYLSQGFFGGNPSLNWTGEGLISVTSIPDVNDTSTWTWTAEWEASGDSLQPTPEPSTLALTAIGGIIGLMMFRRQQKFQSKLKPV